MYLFDQHHVLFCSVRFMRDEVNTKSIDEPLNFVSCSVLGQLSCQIIFQLLFCQTQSISHHIYINNDGFETKNIQIEDRKVEMRRRNYPKQQDTKIEIHLGKFAFLFHSVRLNSRDFTHQLALCSFLFYFLVSLIQLTLTWPLLVGLFFVGTCFWFMGISLNQQRLCFRCPVFNFLVIQPSSQHP